MRVGTEGGGGHKQQLGGLLDPSLNTPEETLTKDSLILPKKTP